MSLVQTVKGLLELIAQAGHAAEAERERDAFEARDWEVVPSDIGRISALLTELTARPPAPAEEPPAAQEPESSVWPEVLAPEAPFLDAIPRGRPLLEGVESILRAPDFDAFREAVAHVFVEVLRYAPKTIDLTDRVGRSSEFAEVRVVAEHDDFRVLVVCTHEALALSSFNFRSSRYEACFRMAPRSILWVFDPFTRHVRVVYRTPGTSGQPRWRALSAPWYVRDPADTLAGWVYRLSRCQPNLDDDGRRLHDRLSDLWHARPGDLAVSWTAPLARSAMLPGLAWHEASTRLTRRMAALDHPHTLGIRGVCRHVFPYVLAHGDWELRLVDIHTGPVVDDDRCWKEGRSSVAEIALEVGLRAWGAASMDTIRLRATLPVADDRGLFWIDGEPWRFQPEVDAEGRLVRTLTADEEDGPDVDTSTELDDDAVDDMEDVEETEDEELAAMWQTVQVQGAAVDQTLLWLAERQLSYLLRTIARAIREADEPTAGDVLAQWIVHGDHEGVVSLVSKRRLREVLVPEGQPWRARPLHLLHSPVDAIPPQPPAWCCPEVSGRLSAGSWAVIAGARLHPFGGLAVPVTRDGRPLLRLEHGVSALWVNPRFADEVGGRRAWWIAHGLEGLADAPGGSIRQAAELARDGEALDGVHRIDDPTMSWAMAPPERVPLVPHRTFRTWWDVPATERNECVVELATEPGAEAVGGATLAHVHIHALSQNRPALPPVLEFVRRANAHHLDVPGPWDERLSLKAPWEGQARIVDAGITARPGPYGVVQGWRVWIEARIEVTDRGEVVTSTGCSAPVGSEYRPEDLPWDREPPEARVWVPGHVGADAHAVFSGRDGGLLLAEADLGACYLPAQVPLGGVADAIGVLGDRVPAASQLPRWMTWWLTALGHPARYEATLRQVAILDLLPSIQQGEARTPREVALPKERRPSTWSVPRLSTVRCGCGLRQGDAWLGHRCSECGELAVARTPRDLPVSMVLPAPVVHPWRKPEAAALLGLDEEELDQVLRHHAPREVLKLIEAATPHPYAQAEARFALPSDHPRAVRRRSRLNISLALHRAESLLAAHGSDAFRLERVPLPPRSLVPFGAVSGAPALVSPGLDRAIGLVRSAIDAWHYLQRIEQPIPRARAEIHLQSMVERLMGRGMEPDGSATVASILAAVQPWRTLDRSTSVPGAEARPAVFQTHEDEARWEAVPTWTDAVPWRMPDGSLLVLPRVEGNGRPSDPDGWTTAAANHRFVARTFPRMAAVLAEAGARLEEVDRAARAIGALADLVLDPSVDVSPWNADAHRDRTTELDASAEQALVQVGKTVRARFAGGGPAREALRDLWCRLSIGWWTDGVRWQWLAEGRPEGVAWHRVQPALGSPVWEAWPAVRSLRASTSFEGMPVLWRALAGLEASPWEDPGAWDLRTSEVTEGADARVEAIPTPRAGPADVEPTTTPRRETATEPEVPSEVGDTTPDVRFWEDTVQDWLRRTG